MIQSSQAYSILQDTFGYSAFRDRQEDIIDNVLEGNDALVIMPTGGGKSLCYQVPALAMPGLTIVVSPLIALMDDQVAALRQLDIAAGALHTNIDPSEATDITNQINSGKLKLLYVSPEKVLSPGFIQHLRNFPVSLIAIDEAHCVSVWGNDFRPEYVKLSLLRDAFPGTPTIALTATADTTTQQDIATQLNLNITEPFVSSFERPNITTEARPGNKRLEQIKAFVRDHEGESGIVYCLSRKSTESLAEKLSAVGVNARAYHAGMQSDERRTVQDGFQNDDIQIVCATIAFGMGIDKPNIRWVIHYNMPKNIEGYYQEIGRAGRDGLEASALLFYSWGDYLNLQRFIDDGKASSHFKNIQRAKLERMWSCATAMSCRTNLVLNYFGEYRDGKCDHCDNCNDPKELFDGTQYAQMALSGIARTKQSIGLNMLIDVLRGSGKQDVFQKGFQNLPTYGVGRQVSFYDWRHYLTQMINQGIISVDLTDGSKLKLTPLSRGVLFDGTKIELAKYVPVKKNAKAKAVKSDIKLDPDERLLDDLRQWRSTQARAQKVPAYVILHDKALKQIASIKPETDQSLLSVDGIGSAKLDKYGEAILDLVRIHIESA